MGSTKGLYYADTPHLGGWIWVSAANLLSTLSGANALTYTRNAIGDYSLNRTAGGAETYQVVTGITPLRRLLESVAIQYQEQFGSAAGAFAPAGPQAGTGLPPFKGTTQLVPNTGPVPKGLKIIDISVVYTVGVAGLTSAALSLNETKYANNAANVIANIPIAATALPLVTQANPYLATRAVTTPAFITDDFSDINAEFNFTMANTGTIQVYGLGFHCQFNYS